MTNKLVVKGRARGCSSLGVALLVFAVRGGGRSFHQLREGGGWSKAEGHCAMLCPAVPCLAMPCCMPCCTSTCALLCVVVTYPVDADLVGLDAALAVDGWVVGPVPGKCHGGEAVVVARALQPDVLNLARLAGGRVKRCARAQQVSAVRACCGAWCGHQASKHATEAPSSTTVTERTHGAAWAGYCCSTP